MLVVMGLLSGAAGPMALALLMSMMSMLGVMLLVQSLPVAWALTERWGWLLVMLPVMLMWSLTGMALLVLAAWRWAVVPGYCMNLCWADLLASWSTAPRMAVASQVEPRKAQAL